VESLSVWSSAIVAAIAEVARLMNFEKDKTLKNCKRGEYTKFFPGVKIELVKYAAQHELKQLL